jgi:uncharacterized membrane protein YraQ (UPF0718 family)
MFRQIVAGPFLMCGAVAIVAASRTVDLGMTPGTRFLLWNSLLSPAAMYIYFRLAAGAAEQGAGRRGIIPMLIGWVVFLPYGLGFYLILYESLYKLVSGELSAGRFVASAALFYAGYVIVVGTYRLTELVKGIDKGALRVDSGSGGEGA